MPDESVPHPQNPTADWTIGPTPAADTRPETATPEMRTPAGTLAQSPDEMARAAAASVRAFGAPVVPGYEILGTLGEGGMGVVYKARQTKLNRVVALKMVLDTRADQRTLIRFLAEAEAVAAVKHANVVQVHDYGEVDGRPFMALEYLPGGTFAKFLESTPREPTAIAKLVANIARGVAAAHALGIIHRDLKPLNVLLDETGVPKVTDFGLAKRGTGSDLTAPFAKMGTPPYMCPEQVDGKTKFVGPQGDVWALGVILYESLTGTRPFNDTDHQILYTRILTVDPAPPRKLAPAIPRDLELICMKCLEKQSHERYPTAKELADDLDRFARHEPISVRPAGPVERAVKWVRRNKVVAGAMAAVLLALAVGTGVSIAFAMDARQEAKAKGEEADRANKEWDRAERERNDAIDKGNKLAKANVEIERNSNELATASAQIILRPIQVGRSYEALGQDEATAFWTLTTARGTPLSIRVVDEAIQSPRASQQLRSRAAHLFHAAVGLDTKLRDEVEQQLLARIEAADTPEEQRVNLAFACAKWEAVSPRLAARSARVLVQAMSGNADEVTFLEFNKSLGVMVRRMEPAEASQLLADATSKAGNPMARRRFAETLTTVAGRLEPQAGADVCARAAKALLDDLAEAKTESALDQAAEGLVAVVPVMESDKALPLLVDAIAMAESRAAIVTTPLSKGGFDFDDLPGVKEAMAARAARTLAAQLPAVTNRADAASSARVLKDALTRTADAEVRRRLAVSLAAVASRMEARAAAEVCRPAARQFAEIISKTADPIPLTDAAQGLVALAGWLEPATADEARRLAAQKLTDALGGPKSPLPATVFDALKLLAGQMPPEDSARMLTDAISRSRDGFQAMTLLRELIEATLRMPPEKGSRLLLDAIDATGDPFAQAHLASGLATVAGRMDRSAAAKTCGPVASRFSQMISGNQDPGVQAEAAHALSMLAGQMDPVSARDACRTAAGVLSEVLIRGQGQFGGMTGPAAGLSALARRMEPREAAPILLQAMTQTRDPNAVIPLAFGLAGVAGRMESDPAAEVCESAARFLTSARTKVPDPRARSGFDAALVAVAGLLTPAETARVLNELLDRSLDPKEVGAWGGGLIHAAIGQTLPRIFESRDAAFLAVGTLAAPDGRLAGLALLQPRFHPLSRPLPPQMLVDLLKHPFCVGELRRGVLQALEVTYNHPFANQWEFAQYARDNKIDVDLLKPLNRPMPTWEFGQFLRPGNIPLELFKPDLPPLKR